MKDLQIKSFNGNAFARDSSINSLFDYCYIPKELNSFCDPLFRNIIIYNIIQRYSFSTHYL
jgi:hypothetical protein